MKQDHLGIKAKKSVSLNQLNVSNPLVVPQKREDWRLYRLQDGLIGIGNPIQSG
jgi:hypothetical protein